MDTPAIAGAAAVPDPAPPPPAAQVARDFRALVLPLSGALLARAYFLERLRGEAWDLVQDTLERALRGFRQFRPGSNVRRWLFRIMHNLFVDWYRRRAHEQRTLPIEDLDRLRPEPDAAAPWEHMADLDLKAMLGGLDSTRFWGSAGAALSRAAVLPGHQSLAAHPRCHGRHPAAARAQQAAPAASAPAGGFSPAEASVAPRPCAGSALARSRNGVAFQARDEGRRGFPSAGRRGLIAGGVAQRLHDAGAFALFVGGENWRAPGRSSGGRREKIGRGGGRHGLPPPPKPRAASCPPAGALRSTPRHHTAAPPAPSRSSARGCCPASRTAASSSARAGLSSAAVARVRAPPPRERPAPARRSR